jgi:hypothetical protein
MAPAGGSSVFDRTGLNPPGTFVGAGMTWQAELGMGQTTDHSGADGTYIDMPSILADVSGNLTTLTAWVRIDVYDTPSGVAYLGSTTGGAFYWQDDGANFAYCQGGAAMGNGGDINDGLWHHLAFVSNGSSGTLYYKDGAQAGSSASMAPSLPTGAKNFEMGKYPGVNTANLDGGLADVRFYNRALSATEIWQQWAPQTCWDLYARPRGAIPIVEQGAAAAAAVQQPFMLLGVGN